MCLLLFGLGQVPGCPVVVAANRDEYYDRESEPPRLLETEPGIVGGYDARAGGTWLGINEHRLIVALTNRRSPDPPDACRKSRGLLCLDALRAKTAEEAANTAVQSLRRESYNPFNLIAIDPAEGWVVSNMDQPVSRILAPGWHIVGNGKTDDPNDPRIARAREILDTLLPFSSWENAYPALIRLCSDHGMGNGDTPESICVHTQRAGTRSASIITVDTNRRIHYSHANGPPCQTDFTPATAIADL